MIVYHGESDDVLRYDWVKPKYDKHLQSLPNFRFKLIPGLPHSVNEEELSESTAWMLTQLKAQNIAF